MAPRAIAEDIAFLVVNSFYQHHSDPRSNRALLSLVPHLEDAGFTVVTYRNMDSNTMASRMSQVRRRLDGAGKRIIIVAGHIVRNQRDSWLLLTDAAKPDGFQIGRFGLPLGEIKDIAEANQGNTVLVVVQSPDRINTGPGFWHGYTAMEVPQGVTVITGEAGPVSGYIANEVLLPGRVLRKTRSNLPDSVRVGGFLPRDAPFIAAAVPGNDFGATADRNFWQQAQAFGSLEAFQEYLQRYPNGIFAQEARQRVQDLTLTPQDQARIAEDNLNLSRDQRRAIQRHLTLLGFDTHGADGVFGRRTRKAVGQWQNSIGVNATGHLNANQISRLQHAAAIRAEELRREAERRRQEEERRDRNYWSRTGAHGTEEGLLAYLQRYPDGLYSTEAQDRLSAIEREKRRQARAAERQAWDRAVIAGTIQSYQRYLNEYPNGRFVEEAKARIQAMSHPETPPDVVEAAKSEEGRLNLNLVTRQLIEGQLKRLGLEPGPADARFTRETRKALRRFQRSANLPVTGYVTQETIVLLLASVVEN